MNGFTLEEDDLERPCLQVRMIEIQANGTAAEVADNIRQRLQELNAPTGVKLYVARIAEDHESLI
jgi:predicted extracellular nuclease